MPATDMLLSYIEKGQLADLRAALVGGSDPNQLSRYGATPLGTAARFGQVPALELLLEKGAKIDALDTQGWTALMTAVTSGHARTVKALLQAGARLDVVNHAGSTVQEMINEKTVSEIVQMLRAKQSIPIPPVLPAAVSHAPLTK